MASFLQPILETWLQWLSDWLSDNKKWPIPSIKFVLHWIIIIPVFVEWAMISRWRQNIDENHARFPCNCRPLLYSIRLPHCKGDVICEIALSFMPVQTEKSRIIMCWFVIKSCLSKRKILSWVSYFLHIWFEYKTTTMDLSNTISRSVAVAQ